MFELDDDHGAVWAAEQAVCAHEMNWSRWIDAVDKQFKAAGLVPSRYRNLGGLGEFEPRDGQLDRVDGDGEADGWSIDELFALHEAGYTVDEAMSFVRGNLRIRQEVGVQ